MKKCTLVFVLLATAARLSAQLIVDNTATPQQIVEDVFLANGIFVANVTFNGGAADVPSVQVGTFDSQNANVGLGSGIVMASGDVNVAVGPNNSSGATLGTIETYSGTDEDLNALIPGYSTNNWAILEFDFIATGDSLSFQYVFGSEEYLEWVGSSFNDVFGFFISGPGISGPYSNSGENIASIPGTDLAVSINNLNNGLNSEYYVDNGDGYTEPYMSDDHYVQFDGLTTVMNAAIGQLQIGETYHIKMAIADAGDGALDSGIFLGGDSFVQFCSEQGELLPSDVCMISHVDAHVTYTESCGTVEIWNDSEMNIDYTDSYYEISNGDVIPATALSTYTFSEPGTYDIALVYEVGEFITHYNLAPLVISLVAPTVPTIQLDGDLIELTNWDGVSQIQWFLNGTALEGANGSTWTVIENGIYSVSVNNGCPAFSQDLSVTVGITESNTSNFQIFPNPGSGLFQVNSTVPLVLDIYNSTGQLVRHELVSGKTQIELTVAGIYTCNAVMLNGTTSTQQLVVR